MGSRGRILKIHHRYGLTKNIIVTFSDDEEGAIQNLQEEVVMAAQSSDLLELQPSDPALGSDEPPVEAIGLLSEVPEIPPSIPPVSESERVNPQQSKGKRSAASDSERHAKKSKKSSDHPLKGKIKKDMVRSASNDIFTLELPKGLAELDKDRCVELIQHLHTADDNFTFSGHTLEQVENAASQKLCQV
ncbi:hypothetical protein ACS0TY_006156 [Phlomoides rotata]